MNTSLDVGAAVAIIASLAGYLPPIAAVLAILWYVINIWESRTVQDWRKRRATNKLTRLRQAATALELQLSLGATPGELDALRAASKVHMAADAAAGQVLKDRKPSDPPPTPGL